jgi:hypothetical protein
MVRDLKGKEPTPLQDFVDRTHRKALRRIYFTGRDPSPACESGHERDRRRDAVRAHTSQRTTSAGINLDAVMLALNFRCWW